MDADELVKQVVNGYFAANSLEPASWIAKARCLAEAAQVLEDTLVSPSLSASKSDPRRLPSADQQFLCFNGICLMLRAYALENLCKAILVRELPDAERQEVIGGTLSGSSTGHDLLKLFNRAGVDADEIERDQLQRLTGASVWFGRYPVPLESGKMFVNESASHRDLDEIQVLEADSVVTKKLIQRALAKAAGA